MRGQHQDLRFQDGSRSQRQVNSHLVTVKIRVESGTGQRVQLDRLALNHFRLEGLDTQTVERRSSVQKDRMAFHHVFKDIPNNRFALVDDFLRGFYRFHDSTLNQLANDKWLVQFSRHVFRKTTLVELQIRTDDNDRTCRVIHTLTQ